eukprot:scaffold11493_cov36-Phaeocystis_antarctica.AAC.1
MAPKRGHEVATSAPTCRNVRNWWIPPLSAGETPCRSVGPGPPKQFSRERPFFAVGRGCPVWATGMFLEYMPSAGRAEGT